MKKKEVLVNLKRHSFLKNAKARGNNKKKGPYVHDSAQEHGLEGDIDAGPLLANTVEQLKAHIGIGRDQVIVHDDACTRGHSLTVSEGCRKAGVKV